ncbi:MAG TPA: alpha/beta hydrolase [Rhabdochlamydiaceae bacterium]|jgi:esterase FrsA|nr:alpha/beta hydrolase [Rhabdochlamydiaceae bacterium]
MLEFLGPPLDAGPLPAVFYFSLSAHDSLHVDPYNQPVLDLSNPTLRIFSASLPVHETLPPTEALHVWVNEIEHGRDVIQTFVQEVAEHIRHLIATQVIDPERVGVMGLSRGAFIGAHLAAIVPEIKHILGFAPLTRLADVEEFQHLETARWDLTRLADKIYNRNIRFYIGNRDTRVGTAGCYQCISTLANTAYDNQISSSPIELLIGPSIGHKGHGTSPEIFRQGAAWLEKKLLGENRD